MNKTFLRMLLSVTEDTALSCGIILLIGAFATERLATLGVGAIVFFWVKAFAGELRRRIDRPLAK